MKSSTNPISVALVVDRDGALIHILRDESGLCKDVSPGQSIVNLVDVASRAKIVGFMEELRLQKAAFDWEVGIPNSGDVLSMRFFGCSADDHFLVIGTNMLKGVDQLIAGLAAVDNEQVHATLEAFKGLAERMRMAADNQTGSMDDLTRLNNELANLQRELAKKNVELEKVVRALQESLEQVKVLTGLLPICASCKKIRDDTGYWNQLEKYLMQHTDVKLTHGLCPDCEKVYFPNLEARQ